MSLTVKEQCIEALVNAFNAMQPEEFETSSGYANDLDDNFLPGVNREIFESEIGAGAGGELEGDSPPMQAVWSSATLVVNNFALWKKEQRHLSLCGVNDLKNLRFEAKCSTGLRGTPPHLDILLEKNNAVVAIESKCLEYLKPTTAKFKKSYDTIKDERANTLWFAQIAILREAPQEYRFLDAAQLVKHYLGLSSTYPGRSVKLLYLYWEPVNEMDFDEFRQHREEIQIFKESIEGDPLQFEALSYLDLWEKWESLSQPKWLSGHLENLKKRYKVAI